MGQRLHSIIVYTILHLLLDWYIMVWKCILLKYNSTCNAHESCQNVIFTEITNCSNSISRITRLWNQHHQHSTHWSHSGTCGCVLALENIMISQKYAYGWWTHGVAPQRGGGVGMHIFKSCNISLKNTPTSHTVSLVLVMYACCDSASQHNTLLSASIIVCPLVVFSIGSFWYPHYS